jgi:uroporphyrinogen-III synthase
MRLIITRPEEDAAGLADKLAALGHKGVVMPLIRIVPRRQGIIPDLSWQAVCCSSANALRARIYDDSLLLLPLLTVGPQSLAEARHRGFKRASAHGGDVNGLCAHISANLKPEAGPLLYLSGSETSADLPAKLKSRGFTVHRETVYDAVPQVPESLDVEVLASDGVLLYSPRTAAHWLAALDQAQLTEKAYALVHYCLSANVAAKLPKHNRITIAATPDENSMLALLDRDVDQT